MGVCKFVDELNKLRKSSSYSIDGVESFDYYKKYMHVSRRVKYLIRCIRWSGNIMHR